ncbi:type IV conjugative transfer system protein TraL [Burkholderia glumae]|uniref:Type IV conjugative transfer system protein TraL n=1 Tax=Burkholderia glumae TaxID=337 RepID=A0ABY5BBJ7_BURGL|nr:type IV conjugative transfer system protein TraL [Burkholderia glumae]ACR32813.1 TraL [Burkholderia glumae BGR1]ACR32923.1 type IV conjugative transfer system protein TraL [Burkholderia glumae BGR1]MCM2496098.1 type IV conjugative transfer system protein TraL [Burkholderia glumae]QHP94818.1 type IV conjugative transfer system protein TraL [Burkholderia glumae]QJW82484.1 type IV conjugative transfer system protein TraL [Burkholderia glumae]
MSEDLNHYVPSRLDDPEKFLFFRKDVASIGMGGVVGGIMLNHVLAGVTLGVALAYGWQKFSSGKHPGMSTHVAYWVIGRPTLKVLPASAIRELNG